MTQNNEHQSEEGSFNMLKAVNVFRNERGSPGSGVPLASFGNREDAEKFMDTYLRKEPHARLAVQTVVNVDAIRSMDTTQ